MIDKHRPPMIFINSGSAGGGSKSGVPKYDKNSSNEKYRKNDEPRYKRQ